MTLFAEKKLNNFEKFLSSESFGTAYDYESIMHYGKTYFAKSGTITIQTKVPFKNLLL